MLAALALAGILAAPATIELTPTDDIWIYPHAGDPEKDTFLRIWGMEGKDVTKDLNEMQNFSYSYLKFDLSKVPEGKLKGATLTVTHIAGPGFDLAYSKKHPLIARPLGSDFTEKGWQYGKSEQLLPEFGDLAILGSGFAENLSAEKEFTMTLDLMKGPKSFADYLNTARSSKSKSLAMALTASLDVEESGQKCIYKIYSKDEEKAARRPVLKLTLE